MNRAPSVKKGCHRHGGLSNGDERALADESLPPHTMAGYTTWSPYGYHRPQLQQFPTGFVPALELGGEKRSTTFSPPIQEGFRHRTNIEPISRKIAQLAPPSSMDTVSCLKLASQASAQPSSKLAPDSRTAESIPDLARNPSRPSSRDNLKDDPSKSKAKINQHGSPQYLPLPGQGNSNSNLKTHAVRYGTGMARMTDNDCSESNLDDDNSAYTEGIASIATNPRVIAIGILAEAPPTDPQTQQDQAMLSQLVANDLAEKEHNLKMNRQEAAIVERRLVNSRIAASIAKRDARISSLTRNFEPRRSSIDSFKKQAGKPFLSMQAVERPTKLPYAKSMSTNEVQSTDGQEVQITPRMRGRKSATFADRHEKIRTARASMTRLDDPPTSYSIPSSTPTKPLTRKQSMFVPDDFSVDAPTGGGDITTTASSACSVVTYSSGIDLDDMTREKIIARSASMHMARRQRSLLVEDAMVASRKGSLHSKVPILANSDGPKKTDRSLSATSSTSSSHSRRSSRKERTSLRVSLTESFNSKTKGDLLSITGNQELHEQDDDLPFGPVTSLDFANDVEEVDPFDLEAQAGVPVVLPGAFAVRPINAARPMHSSGYDSGFEEDSVKSAEEHEEEQVSSNIEVLPERSSNLRPVVSNDPVQAELYDVDYADAQVVDAAVDSGKSSRTRTRWLCAIMVFIAIAVAVGVAVKRPNGVDEECQNGCVRPIQGWEQVGELLMGPTDSDNIRFGYSVAMSRNGSRLAIGIPGLDIINDDEETISKAGGVKILDFNGTAWTTIHEIKGLEKNGEAGTAVVMSQDGNRVAFGAPKAEGGGYVAMFEEALNGTWGLVCELLGSEFSGSMAFGTSLSLSANGRILAVGDRNANQNENRTSVGAVRIFEQGNFSWEKLGEEIHGQEVNDFVGESVALSQDGLRVAVSAVGSDNRKGEVRIFDFEEDNWVRVGSILLGQTEAEIFGTSLALSKTGDVLAIGAPGYAESGSSVGRVYAYQYDVQRKDWTPMSDPIEGDRQFDRFGSAVALSANGDVLAIGSPENDDFGNNAGFIVIMRYDGTSWSRVGSQLGRQDNEGGMFASSIALSTDGRRVVGGAPQLTFDGKFNAVGRAWVYEKGEDA